MASVANHLSGEFTEDDRIYITLPLYHVAGGMLGMSQALMWGTPVIIRNGFSASAFWKDIVKYKATVSYLVSS